LLTTLFAMMVYMYCFYSKVTSVNRHPAKMEAFAVSQERCEVVNVSEASPGRTVNKVSVIL